MIDAYESAKYLARTKTATHILMLDFDGVLHHEAVYVTPKRGIHVREPGRTLFEWAHFLVEALAPYPEVRIVLSTTWCIRPGFARAKSRLPIALRERVIGGTYHSGVHGADPHCQLAFRQTSRATQVLADVARRRPTDWLALDDDVADWPAAQLDHLVACDGSAGLSSPATRELLHARLARFRHA